MIIAALVLCCGREVLCWLEEFQFAVLPGVSATLLLYFKPELRRYERAAHPS